LPNHLYVSIIAMTQFCIYLGRGPVIMLQYNLWPNPIAYTSLQINMFKLNLALIEDPGNQNLKTTIVFQNVMHDVNTLP